MTRYNQERLPQALAMKVRADVYARSARVYRVSDRARMAAGTKAWMVPIPGTGQMPHVVENSGATDVRLTPSELVELNAGVLGIEIPGAAAARSRIGLHRC